MSVNKVTTAGEPRKAIQKVELCYRCDGVDTKQISADSKPKYAESAIKLDTYKEHVDLMYNAVINRDSARLRKRKIGMCMLSLKKKKKDEENDTGLANLEIYSLKSDLKQAIWLTPQQPIRMELDRFHHFSNVTA